MGVVGRAATVAGAVKGTTGRHPLSSRLKAVLPMVRDTMTGRWPGAPRGRVLAGIVGIVYVLSPLDVLPEIIFGPFGLGDDLTIAALSAAALLTSAEAWLDSKETAYAASPSSAKTPGPDVIVGEVIDRA